MNKLLAILATLCVFLVGCHEVETTPSVVPNSTGPGTLDVYVGSNQPPPSTVFPGSLVKFTEITLTSISGTNTVYGILVERVGYSSNDAFLGVLLLDEVCNDVGSVKTLSSTNNAVVGGPIVIPEGASRTFWVAGIMAPNLVGHDGELVAFAINDIVTNANTLTGDHLPTVGAMHTVDSAYAPTETVSCLP